MIDEVLENFITQTFTQCFANLKLLYYIPSDLIFQRFSFRDNVKKTEINRVKKGYIIDPLSIVDIE